MPEDPEILTQRLRRARIRAEDAPPFSPDWDAAMAAVEDLERRLRAATREAPTLARADAR